FCFFFFFFQAEDGIRDGHVTGVQTCALPIFQFAETSRWSLSAESSPSADNDHRLVSANWRGAGGPRALEERRAFLRRLRALPGGTNPKMRSVPAGHRPGRAGARRIRTKRHGGVFWGTARRFRL